MDIKNLVKHAPLLPKFFVSGENTYAEALRRAVGILREKEENCPVSERLRHRYILFVPDKYTLHAEKLMYGRGGSFSSEVLTLNRLCYRIFDYEGCSSGEIPLSRLGAILSVRKAVSDMTERGETFRCFGNSARYAGFGEMMYDNISQLAASGLSSSDLPELGDGLLAHKLHDIKKVYAEFEKATAGKFVDAAGRLMLTYKLLCGDTDYFDGCDVVFAAFDDFTPLTARIAEKICLKCGEGHAYIVDAKCELRLFGAAVEEYAAENDADAVKAAAERIRKYALGGASYDDMGVVAATDPARLKRIFDEYEVPYFSDEKYALSSHPLARYITDLFTAARSGSTENYIRLSKNPYCGIERGEADNFENVLALLSVGEWGLSAPLPASEAFDEELAGDIARAEEVRKKLRRRAAGVHIGEIRTGADFTAAIANAIPADESEISENYNSNFPDAREEILAAVEVISAVYSHPTAIDALMDAMRECFALREVRVIPNSIGRVEVGDVSAFRVSGKKYLFVLGMNDGVLPAVRPDDGILSDADLDAVERAGGGKAKIEPSIERLNARAEEELRSLLSGSENLFLSYIKDEAVSPVLAEVRRGAKNLGSITVGSREAKLHALAGEDGRRNTEALKDLCPTPASGLELYLTGNDDIKAGGVGYGYEAELHALLGSEAPRIREAETVIKDADSLYRTGHTSVSRVQTYFACPLEYFFKYGLRLRPRPNGEASAADIGTLLHRVAELYILSRDYSDPSRDVPLVMARIKEENPLFFHGMSDSFTAELTKEAVKLCSVAARQIESGEFVPKLTEAQFGKPGSALDGLTVKADGGSLTVDGIIDRLDTLDIGDGKFAARVVDYKTGYSKFDYADVYYGTKIQLPVYLKVAERNGYTPVGMFYFPFSSGFVEDETSYRLRGIFDASYAKETDGKLASPDAESDVVAARSTKNSSEYKAVLNKNSLAAVSRELLDGVCDYAVEILRAGVNEALGGYCAPSPLVSAKRDECAYCDGKCACAVFGASKRERMRKSVRKQIFEKPRSEGGDER